MANPVAGKLYCICFEAQGTALGTISKGALQPYDTEVQVKALFKYLKDLQKKYPELPHWIEDESGQRYD